MDNNSYSHKSTKVKFARVQGFTYMYVAPLYTPCQILLSWIFPSLNSSQTSSAHAQRVAELCWMIFQEKQICCSTRFGSNPASYLIPSRSSRASLSVVYGVWMKPRCLCRDISVIERFVVCCIIHPYSLANIIRGQFYLKAFYGVEWTIIMDSRDQ